MICTITSHKYLNKPRNAFDLSISDRERSFQLISRDIRYEVILKLLLWSMDQRLLTLNNMFV